jgi:hypothetical protein
VLSVRNRVEDQVGEPAGHSSITITLDRYGHLMPGSEDEAAGMLERYLAREASG